MRVANPDAKALIVDNEPEVFWDGHGAADLVEQWRQDVRFDDHPWGRVALAPDPYALGGANL